MRRIPVVATLVVALAIAAMTALGVWQLDRRQQKLAQLASYARNAALPPIEMPRMPDDKALFRRAHLSCAGPVSWHSEAGRDAAGRTGWRQIAQCRADRSGPGALVQLGVAADAAAHPDWNGGALTGYITHAPDHRALIVAAIDPKPKILMLMAGDAIGGLRANPPANLDDVPNNHLAYAIQWFLFAAVAAVIYAIALYQRSDRSGGNDAKRPHPRRDAAGG